MVEQTTIREPSGDDAGALGSVHVRAWQAAYRGLMPDDYLDGLDVDERAEMWERALERPPRSDVTRLVSEDEQGSVVGFIVVGPSGDDDGASGEVHVLNVDPRVWGRGHGRALLDAGEQALAEVGFGDAILWVHPGNARARRFYERSGWTHAGVERVQEVFGIEVPEVLYRRDLDAPRATRTGAR